MTKNEERIHNRIMSLRGHVNEQINKTLETKLYTSSYEFENIVYDALQRLGNVCQFMTSVKIDIGSNSEVSDFVIYISNVKNWTKRQTVLNKSFSVVPQAILHFCNERNLENLAWSVYSIQPEMIQSTIASSLPPILRSAAAITR